MQGLLISLLYENDLLNSTSHLSLIMFADNTKHFLKEKNLHTYLLQLTGFQDNCPQGKLPSYPKTSSNTNPNPKPNRGGGQFSSGAIARIPANRELLQINGWIVSNNLSLNVVKPKFILLYKPNKVDNILLMLPKFLINNQPLKTVDFRMFYYVNVYHRKNTFITSKILIILVYCIKQNNLRIKVPCYYYIICIFTFT